MRYRQGHVTHSDTAGFSGLQVTTAERTLFDLTQTEPFEVALACADQHLRATARTGTVVDSEAMQGWRDRTLARIGGKQSSAWSTRARALVALADPRADSPLESISRLRFLQLGIDVELQYPVRSERGGIYLLDFWLLNAPYFGECDGKHKYTDPGLRGGRSPEEVVYQEKRRHDWVSGSTGRRGLRWGAPDVMTVAAFAKRLRAFGVAIPGAPSQRYGPEVAALLASLA